MQHTDTGENAEDCQACQEDHHRDGRGFDGLWNGRRGAGWRHQAYAGDRGHSNEDRNQAGEYGDNSGGNDRTGWSRRFHGSAIYHFRGRDDSAEARAKCEVVSGVDQLRAGSGRAGSSNWRFTLGKRKKKIHQRLTGKSAITKEMASSCLNDSSSLTNLSGMKNVSNGRNAITYRQKQSATLAHKRAARLAHGFN